MSSNPPLRICFVMFVQFHISDNPLKDLNDNTCIMCLKYKLIKEQGNDFVNVLMPCP